MRHWTSGKARAALLAVGAAGVLALAPGGRAGAQVEMEPLPTPVTVFLSEQPVVTVTLEGNHGPVRVTGSLDQQPEGTLHVTDLGGRPREVRWNEVVSLTRTEYPQEGLPSARSR